MTNKEPDAEARKISRLRDQSFEDAYKVHDVGSALVRDRLQEYNLQAFQHGDDRRDEDDVYSGTGVDLGVQHSGDVCGWIEVKTKQSEDWMGRYNYVDHEEYRGFATYRDEPVFVYFCHVKDLESAAVGDRYFVRVPPTTEDDIATKLPFTSKGKEVIEIPDAYRLSWPDVVGCFLDHLNS